MFFFFNDTATTEIYTLSLHDALPIYNGLLQRSPQRRRPSRGALPWAPVRRHPVARIDRADPARAGDDRRRSEEHTSELQSRQYLVCRLLLEKKKYLDSTYKTYH